MRISLLSLGNVRDKEHLYICNDGCTYHYTLELKRRSILRNIVQNLFLCNRCLNDCQ